MKAIEPSIVSADDDAGDRDARDPAATSRRAGAVPGQAGRAAAVDGRLGRRVDHGRERW